MATKTSKEETTDLPAGIMDDDGGFDLTAIFGSGKGLWDELEGQKTFEPLPEGTYDAVVEVVEGPMPNNAQDGYNMKFTFDVPVEGDDIDSPVVHRKVFMYLSMKETARWKVQQVFSALGKEPGENTYYAGEFDGKPCRIVLKIQKERPKNDGTDDKWPANNSVNKVLPPRADQEDGAWI